MPRTLIVEDDQDLLALTAELLSRDAEVDTAADPRAALNLLQRHRYDLLVTDLHIEGPGDGLLLAGVCRVLHPKARTVLITGFPDFTRSLEAIQSTLDAVLIKPVDMETLRGLHRGGSRAQMAGAGRGTVWELLQRRQTEIVGRWLKLVEDDAVLGTVPLELPERVDHMNALMHGLSVPDGAQLELESAAHHGHHRKSRNYRPHWISLEIAYLRRAIWEAVLNDLLQIDLSRFPVDMFELNTRLDDDLLESLRAFGLEDPR